MAGTRTSSVARSPRADMKASWCRTRRSSRGWAAVCERIEDAHAALRAMGDVIVKPLFGSMGLGMLRVSDEDMAFRVFRALEAVRAVYYLQRTIPHEGRD